jgi:hypothetical protein
MALTRQVERRVLILTPTNAEVSTNQVYAARYEWRVDGELTLPTTTIIDSLKHVDAAFSIYRVDVSVNEGGTSEYRVIIKSYDTAGLNPVTHVDNLVTITGDRNRVSIPVLNAAVDQNTSLELTIFENSVGMPAKDMTVTLIAEDFADLQPEREGHRILDESNVVFAQRPDLKFDTPFTVTDDAINNRTVVSMNTGFIGQMLESMLSEAQMQALYGTGWILADGRSVVGSTYESITGFTNAPDARSMILRGKNYSRADAFADPDGDKAVGTQTQDKFESHTHTTTFRPVQGLNNGGNNLRSTEEQNVGSDAPTAASGGNETAPKTLTVNIFIKID